MPTPKKGEKRKDWMKRCIPALIAEGNDSEQAVAICSSMWDDRKKKKK
jgi:gluconate kinase